MSKLNDYNNYDKTTIFVKKTMSKEILEHYKIFGWEIADENDNETYEDIIDITLIRPHKINNKDELQFLQVAMEEKFNKIGRLEKYKNAKTTSLGLIFGIIGLVLITLGILMIIKVLPFNILSLSIITTALGLISFILGITIVPNLHKNEINHYSVKKKILEEELEEIYKKVSSINGDKYER